MSAHITNFDLFRALRPVGESRLKDVRTLSNYLYAQYNVPSENEADRRKLTEYARMFTVRVQAKWRRSHRREEQFLTQNREWLSRPVTFKATRLDSGGSKRGRANIECFSEMSERSKRRKTLPLRNSVSIAELSHATTMGLRASGNVAAAHLLEESTSTSPTRAGKIYQKWKDSQEDTQRPTMEAVLFLFADCGLSKRQYQKIRLFCKSYGADILPTYEALRAEKQKCYPSESAISVTENSAVVQLQALVDHTAERVLHSTTVISDSEISTEMLWKWGLDGSSAHVNYQQVTSAAEPSLSSDTGIVLTSMVPLRLTRFGDNDQEPNILWENPNPNYSHSCRPLRMIYAKETSELINSEMASVREQEEQLRPTVMEVVGRAITVSHKFICSMVDGKVKSHATSSSMQSCNICGAKPSHMNKIEEIKLRPVSKEAMKFGLSPLHALLRFFSLVMNIACRLSLPKPSWQVKGKENQALMSARKAHIQRRFRDEMGLLVDIPKSGGVGNTTSGNTARRIFDSPEKAADITGVSLSLIQNFAGILQVLRTTSAVNVAAFQAFAESTAKHFCDLYGWYYMPSSVHVVLMHGAQVMAHLPVPIGLLSEEPQEGRNKDIRRYREHHSRKTSRIDCNTDVLCRLLLTSDPYVLSLLMPKQEKKRALDPRAAQLLQNCSDPAYALTSVTISDTDSD